MKSELRWLPGFLALGVVWGSSFLFIELALESFTPVGIVFLRSLLGALSLAVILLARREWLPAYGRHWVHLAVVALLLNAVPGFLFALGQQWVPSSLAGIVNATTPLIDVVNTESCQILDTVKGGGESKGGGFVDGGCRRIQNGGGEI